MREVPVVARSPGGFEAILDHDRYDTFTRAMEELSERLDGRCVWHISSTSSGGGVAEMLRSLLGYAVGAGIQARWMVLDPDEGFFRVTKRLHHHLHGEPGDGGELGEAERRSYMDHLNSEFDHAAFIDPRDVVVAHDPQTAGLLPLLEGRAAATVWRCHIGVDSPNQRCRRAWKFLLPSVDSADAIVFSRRSYVWEGLDGPRVRIIPPAIDAFSAKNQPLSDDTVQAILPASRVMVADGTGEPEFSGEDGSIRRVERQGRAIQTAPCPPDVPIIVQVSRWDALKDPVGVLRGFDRIADETGAHLILAGPDPDAVADDPEEDAVLEEVSQTLRASRPVVRERTHLALLPMEDLEENAAIVNALQRRADVIVQKSIAEGFGLTVAEAMWKGRPTIASRVGGIQDQIEHGRSGLLVDDPKDLVGFGRLVTSVLADSKGALQMGVEAHERVRDRFLMPSDLTAFAELVLPLLDLSPRCC